MNKKTKSTRKLIIVIILFIGVIEFFRYSPKEFIDIINVHENQPIIVSKSDVDENDKFHFFHDDISDKEQKEMILNYLKNRKVKRVNKYIEPYFDPNFQIYTMEPRYDFWGKQYMGEFEIITNKYIMVYNSNLKIRSYYKFIDELDLNKFEGMMELKKIR